MLQTGPNFLIGGGVAAGTSFLSASLTQHPDIYLPKVQRPEPNFFHYSWKYERGMEWYKTTWFSEVGEHAAVGERSSLLLPSAPAPQRIARNLPHVRLIFCLRNPMERAWANYRFTVLEGLEPLPFVEALRVEEERGRLAEGKWSEVQPHAYLARSSYSTSLSEYIELFGREQVLLLQSEDLGLRPDENLRKVCSFLGVDPSFRFTPPPNYTSPSVIDKGVQAQLRDHFGERFPEVIECIRRGEDVTALIMSEADGRNVDRLRANLRGGKDPLPEELRVSMRHFFAEELNVISELVDFPLDQWK